MLQRTTYKSRALITAICIVTALLVLSVFPLRLWRGTVTFEGQGKPLVMSDPVNSYSNESQVFVAQYDRIGAIDIYVAEITGGRYLEAELKSADDETLFHRIIDMREFEVPGYVRINAGVGLVVGQQYRLYLKGRYCAFRLGLEPAAANPVPYMGAFFSGYDPNPSLRLQMAAHYDVPVSKGKSLLLIAAFLAIAALLCLVVRLWYRRHPEQNGLVLVSVLTERTLYALTGAFYLTLFVLNFPLKRFNDRPVEIAFLAIGITVAALVSFYAVRRFCTEPAAEDRMPLKDRIAAVFMALAIAYGCEYMNGVSNLMHAASERQMLFCLLVVILLSFRTDMLVNRINLLWIAAAGGVVAYVLRNTLHAQSEQEALQNTVTRCNALNVLLAGLILISAVRSLRAKVWKKPRLSRFGLLTAAMLAGLVICSGTRVTGLILCLLCATLYVCVGCNIPPARFIRILVWGVNINFVLSVGYCLLFRAFQAFIFTRYGMVFHTVAVTGEYLASVTLFATAQLLLRFAKDRETLSFRLKIRHAWREILLFAVSGTYAVFTISRTAYVTIAAGVLILLFTCCAARATGEGRKRIPVFAKRFATLAAVLLCSCALLFPAVFSMQRILPAMAGRHRPISVFEETSMIHDVLGSARWDSTYYISIMRFWSMFRARILRLPELFIFAAEDKYNFDDRFDLIYTTRGELRQDAAGGDEAQPGQPKPDEAQPEEPLSYIAVSDEKTGESAVDVSNGRLDIFRTYLERLDWKGHDVLFTEDPYYIHAHNSYLQVMYTNGIPAGVLFTVWVICACAVPLVLYRKSAVTRKDADAEGDAFLITAASAVAFAMAGLTEMNFQLSNPMCLLLFTGMLPLVFRKDETACYSVADCS